MNIDSLKESEFCIIKCYTNWCGPCKSITQKYNDLSLKYSNNKFKFFSVELVEDNFIEEKFYIMSLPTFLIIRNSEEIDRIEGTNMELLENILKFWIESTK